MLSSSAHVGQRVGHKQHRGAQTPTASAASLLGRSRRKPCRQSQIGAANAAAAPIIASPKPDTVPLPWDLGSSSTIGLRDGMEDDMQLQWDPTLKQLYCGVFDGHGGSAAAQWLARELHAFVSKAVQSEAKPADKATADQIKKALAASFTTADAAVISHLEGLGPEVLSNAGSTATVVLANETRLVAANIGDSQAYVQRKNQALPLTTPHRVYGSGKEVKAEVERVKATGAWIYDGRVCNILAVSRAFGDWEFKAAGLQQLVQAGVQRGLWPQEFADKQKFTSAPVIVTPALAHLDLQAADEFAVVATDGLWDVIEPADAMRWAKNKFKAGRNAQEVAEGLVAVALKRYSTDNISVIVLDFKGAEYWQANGGGAKAAGKWLGGLFK